MAGYSKTPLSKKLGIKANMRVLLINAPKNFTDELHPLPEDVSFITEPEAELPFALIFSVDSAELTHHFHAIKPHLAQNGMIWVAWPKKAAKVPTDIVFDVAQGIGLDAGLVDTKICAVNEIWSGLKFVYRTKDRKKK